MKVGKQLLYKIINFLNLVILSWFVDRQVKDAALTRKRLIEEDEVEMRPEQIPASCLEDNVFVPSVQKYFSPDAWIALMNVLKRMLYGIVEHVKKLLMMKKKTQLFANRVLTGFISLVYQSREIQNKLNGFVEVVTSNYYFD